MANRVDYQTAQLVCVCLCRLHGTKIRFALNEVYQQCQIFCCSYTQSLEVDEGPLKFIAVLGAKGLIVKKNSPPKHILCTDYGKCFVNLS